MNSTVGCRFRVGSVALLALMGTLTLAGATLGSVPAGADSGNLIQNGNFETVSSATSSYLPVFTGGASTIQGWTVFTPSIYSGRGSVDVTSTHYWNAQDGQYSIDLAGTSASPGGIYQNVTTTPGVEYSLSFWSAVNGDETPHVSHTMGVTVSGLDAANNVEAVDAADTVTASSVGRPLKWVQNAVTFTASSASTQIAFADTTATDTIQGPALDNVSLTAVPDVITASSVTIAPQTTGVSFTAPVATFTDSYAAPPLSDFSASISWGDSTSSAGTIGRSSTAPYTYTVTGAHSYGTHGTYPVEVSISSVAGGSASVPGSVTVADAVTTCSGSGCSGTVSTPSQTVQIASTSTSGTILTTVDSTAFSCGDSFRHAPQIVTVTDTGLNANIVYTVTFANKSAAGSWLVPFAVCYQAETPFTDLSGHQVTTGLLPLCTVIPRPNKPLVAPCVQSITELPLYLGNVVEKIVLPPGDPKFH